MSDYLLFVPLAGKSWINANQRLFWMERSRRTQAWRGAAREAAISLHIPHFTKASVVCELLFADSRRRDPANWAPTAKACVDGMVDAGVFPDDNYKHVTGPDMRIGAPVIAAAVGLRLWIKPEENEMREERELVKCDICSAPLRTASKSPLTTYEVGTRKFAMPHRDTCPMVAAPTLNFEQDAH